MKTEAYIKRLEEVRRNVPANGFSAAIVGDKIAITIGTRTEELGATALLDANTAYAMCGAIEELVDDIRKENKKVTIRGVEYPSMKEAAKALNVAYTTVTSAAQRGTLDNVGRGAGSGGRSYKPITIRGVEYPSQTVAAKALGISPSVISAAKRRGRLEFVGLGSQMWRD